MDLGLTGRVALVTGGSRGIGLASAQALAREGCALAVTARSPEGVEAAVAGLRDAGARAAGVPLDLGEADAPARAVAFAEAELGPVEVLVANAGGPPLGGFDAVDEAGWDVAVRQNLMSAVRLMRACLPGMRERGWGRVVTITSSSVREPIDGLALSNAVRPAVAGVVHTVAREVAADGVTVNNVMPGAILTARLREIAASRGADPDEALAARAAGIPARRLGRPEEVGDLVAFLASDAAAYVNGVSIFCDGAGSRALA
jgi:3-oxoacyl-[acyl-carrier protein] reductase